MGNLDDVKKWEQEQENKPVITVYTDFYAFLVILKEMDNG
jgi:hypothetical protein